MERVSRRKQDQLTETCAYFLYIYICFHSYLLDVTFLFIRVFFKECYSKNGSFHMHPYIIAKSFNSITHISSFLYLDDETMAPDNHNLKVLSVNVRGLGESAKRRDVFNYLKSKKCQIYCLQDTHFTSENEKRIRCEWGGECIFNSYRGNSRGVSILFSNDVQFDIKNVEKDDKGNFIGLNVEIDGKMYTLITIYGPNEDNPFFSIR